MNEQTNPNVFGEPEFVHPQWAPKSTMFEQQSADQYWPRYGPTMYMFSHVLTERDQRGLRELERSSFLHGRTSARSDAYDEMVESMRGLLLEHGRECGWARTEMDALLLHLKMNPTAHRYDVEVRFGDSEVLLIAGVEADDASAARNVVEEGIEVAARVQVDVSVVYDGPGKAVECEIDFEYDDNDSLEQSVVDEITGNMEFEVQECEDTPW